MIIGYARVSTHYQKFDSQLNSLEKFGCDMIYTECDSGRNSKRIELKKALSKLNAGDTFVICKLDRLSRGTKHLLLLMEEFNNRNINFISIQNNIDTSTSMGKFFFTIMSAFAEMEVDLIRERVLAGLNTAKENGVKLGRPRKEVDLEQLTQLYIVEKVPINKIAEKMNLSRPTVYKYLKEQKIFKENRDT